MVTKKNVLITAGSTWVALDRVRVISNIASGETGFILANKFKEIGAKVTLLLGPGDFCGLKCPGVKIINFKYFTELKHLLEVELKKRKYAAVVHAAAVADYQPEKISAHKVSSQLDNWKINLKPTEKLINNLKKYAPDLFTVGFKFEPEAGRKRIIKEGTRLLKQANLDWVVANSNKNKAYQAYIFNDVVQYGPFLNKLAMASCLSKLINKLI